MDHPRSPLFATIKQANLGPAVLFKGSALAHTVYPKPWLRPRSDSDIIIEANQREAFDKILIELGYRKHFALDGQYVSYQNTYSKALVGQSAINIDLHWRINNRQILAKAYTATELYNNGSNLDGALTNARIPSPVDSIIIASLHRVGHHHNEERLSWLYDIHLLASPLNPKQWQDLIAKTASKQLAAITLDALENCRQLFATKIAQHYLDALFEQSQKSEPSQLFLQRDLAEWRYFMGDMRGLASFSEKFNFLKESIFPSPTYIRARMGTRSAIYGYVKRLILGARRFL